MKKVCYYNNLKELTIYELIVKGLSILSGKYFRRLAKVEILP